MAEIEGDSAKSGREIRAARHRSAPHSILDSPIWGIDLPSTESEKPARSSGFAANSRNRRLVEPRRSIGVALKRTRFLSGSSPRRSPRKLKNHCF